MKFKKILYLLVAIVFLWSTSASAAVPSSATGTLGADQWYIASDGTLVPNGSYGITLDGVTKTEWGSIVSPMTDASGYVYPTDSGAVYRLYDTGYLSLGGGTAIDVYLLLDTDDDDWYIGRDDTDNDFAIGVGSTLGTDERISITDDATATIVVIGDGVNAEDKQITIDGNALDYYIAYDDSEDMLVAGVDATVGTKPAFGLMNEANPLLYVYNGIDGVGAIDIDIGSGNITDVTVVTDGGTLILDGTITLTDSEVISNATDDTIRVASNDLDTIFEVYTPFDTTGDATLKLSADLGDAAGEQWTITSTGATTDLVIGCDDSSSGTPITRFTISDAGVVTTMGTVNLAIADAGTSSVTDVLNIQHFTSGTAAAGYGVGLTFDIENASGGEEEHFSMDVVATTATNGSEDTDVVFNLMNAGALSEVARLDADAGMTLTSGVTVVPVLSLVNTNTDANSASLNFQKDGNGEADGDVLGLVTFTGNDSGNADQIFGYLKFTSTDITAATEAGGLELSVEIADTDTNMFYMYGDAGAVTTGHVEFNVDSADIDFSIDGNSIADLFNVDADTDTISMALNAADSQLLITQTDTTGTTTAPLIFINDDRTGTNANTAGEATLMIDPQGTHAINIVDGIVYSGGIIQGASDLKFQTDIFATGHCTGTSALASAVTGIGSEQPMSYGVVTKDVGSTETGGTWSDGTVGQMVTIACGTFAGAGWTVTPVTTTGFTSFKFDTALDSITILFLDATRGWIIVGNNGCTIA